MPEEIAKDYEAQNRDDIKKEQEEVSEEKLWIGVLNRTELSELKSKLEKLREIEFAEKEKELINAKAEDFLVNENNLASLLYTSSKVELDDAASKAKELTAFIESLLRPGIYASIAEAYEEGVPVGTFIIVDDPKTDRTDFTVKVVIEPVLDESLIKEEEA